MRPRGAQKMTVPLQLSAASGCQSASSLAQVRSIIIVITVISASQFRFVGPSPGVTEEGFGSSGRLWLRATNISNYRQSAREAPDDNHRSLQ